MKNTEYTLYLDMDGVLTDFDKGYTDLYYSVIHGHMTKDEKKIAAQREYVKQGAQFWIDLPWMHGGKELWNAAHNLFETVCILSSAQAKTKERGEAVTAGKKAWLKTHIPEVPDNQIFIVMDKTQKQDHSHKMAILVDDREDTIQMWQSKGGYGILHDSRQYKKSIEELEDIARPISLSEIVKRFRH